MTYPERREAAKHARAFARYLLSVQPMAHKDIQMANEILKKADDICMATPTVLELFELNRDNYEFMTKMQVPRSIRMRMDADSVPRYCRKEICRRWYMSVVKAGGKDPKVISSRSFEDDGTMIISSPSYPYTLCVTTHVTNETDVYQIVVNINE